ncbi:MAG TPA: nuclear transport factor 2 family protein [Solirubrobacteraceae bacterium]|nr:nuclear transport factor 2 family protein [Solirubrobacteraceae bacterium]
MSQANADAVRAVWPREVDLVEMVRNPELFSPFAAHVDRDIEVVFTTGAPGVGSLTFHGFAGLVAGWRDWVAPYESYRLEVENFIDAGEEHVLCPARVEARTRRDGVLIEHSPAAVFTVRDGQVTQATFHLERHRAYEAVGLRA